MDNVEFSTSQRKIVEQTKGAMAVIASAGTGKTRVLTGRVRQLIEKVPGAFKILSLTYTNKAAEEMKNRLSSIPNVENRVFIGTIHSFCLNIIREKGHIIGYDQVPHLFEKESDRLEVIKEVILNNEILTRYYEQGDERRRRTFLYDALDHISNRKRNLKMLDENKKKELSVLFNDYNRVLAEQNAIDYDDIIIFAYRIFSERPKIAELYRKIYQYICVDEAQDLNYAQYQLIKILCGDDHNNVLMVGDDKQAIFGFNGSDKRYFSVDFVVDFNAQKVCLTENYRSSKSIIRIANNIYPDSIKQDNAVYEGLFESYIGEDESDEAEYVANKITHYLNQATQEEKDQIEGNISLEKMCVIARNRFIFKSLEEKLESEKIPYFYKKGSETTLFDSDEMKIFESGIRVILNPLDKLHLRQIHAILKNDVSPLRDFNEIKKYLLETGKSFIPIVRAWEQIENNNKNLRDALNVISNNLSDIDKKNEEKPFELMYKEILLAKEYWQKYCSSVSADSISIQGFLGNIALGMVSVKNEKEQGLTLGTVHSVKGLEYDIVFVVGLNEGSFPDYRAVRVGGKQLDEEKNLTNVAITRAKRFLHISYPKMKFMPWDRDNPYPQKPSRFLRGIFN